MIQRKLTLLNNYIEILHLFNQEFKESFIEIDI